MLNGNQQMVNTMTIATIILIIYSFSPDGQGEKNTKRRRRRKKDTIKSYLVWMMYARLLME